MFPSGLLVTEQLCPRGARRRARERASSNLSLRTGQDMPIPVSQSIRGSKTAYNGLVAYKQHIYCLQFQKSKIRMPADSVWGRPASWVLHSLLFTVSSQKQKGCGNSVGSPL